MEDLDLFIKQVKKNAKKLRGKHSPISELVDNQIKVLKISNIYDLIVINHLYLFKVRNHSQLPKKRYFLSISIVSQSSDLLVNIAQNIFKNNEEIRLVQYSLYPETSRINLLALMELKTIGEYEDSVKTLVEFRKKYRKHLQIIVNKLQL